MGRMKRVNGTGFTLVEMLFCVWILSILAILVISGFRAMKRSMDSMEEQYQADMLAGKLLEFITEEIRYSRYLSIEHSEDEALSIQISYTSDSYGRDTILKIDTSEADGTWGYLTILCGGTREYRPYESLYGHLRMGPLDDGTPVFQKDSHEKCIVVSFGICNETGEVKAIVEDVHIRLLN